MTPQNESQSAFEHKNAKRKLEMKERVPAWPPLLAMWMLDRWEVAGLERECAGKVEREN